MELPMKNPLQISFIFFFCIFLSPSWELGMAQNSTAVIDVGVILDLDTWIGKMGQTCISMALSDFYQAHNHITRLVLHTRDSKEDVVGAAAEALDLLKNVQVKAIIGPESSAQAKFAADLGRKSQVPILSFSATSPSLSSSRNPYFIRTAHNDSSQFKAIAAIVRAFGWREVVPIYEDTDYGRGIIPFLTDALQEIDAKVPYRSMIATDAQIVKELRKLKTMQTRVFVVHMCFSSLGSHFFSKVKDAGMMSEGYVWITTNGITDFLDSMASSVIDSMHGVLGVKPYVPKSEKLNNFTRRWRRKILLENPRIEKAELSTIGLWAYDTVQALAMAVEQVGAMKSHFQRPEAKQNSNDLSSLGVSETGPELLDAILNTAFEGLSGKFHLIGRQLPSSAFQIINVVGKGMSEIGFWTPVSGLSKVLNETSNKMYSASMDDLMHVNWPGQLKTLPRGWMIAPNEKKLRIGVPVENEFIEILNVSVNNNGNVSATGFCIDVFEAARKRLPYDLPYEFVQYANASGGSAGNYDDLVYQVFLQDNQKYDAVVADTTIIANRSKYVDFTLPYTESGVSMVVPIKDDKSKNAWIFLKPLSWNLWLTSIAAFVVTGFVVWVLEHRINDDFRGPPAHQIGVMFLFSFSTLVFAHKEKVVSNLSRFVMIIWVFVVLILTSSYTASLTSMLTVQQLHPTVTDVKDLIRNGENVGYKKDSFVLGLLKNLGFADSKLRALVSPEEYNEALSKGVRNDGVAAIFDEIPYIKLLLGKYCGQYMMVGPTYKTDGFGFVFPKGSPLVHDFSQAILEVREGDEMVKIEQQWFGQQAYCADSSPTDASNSLTLDSFWGLFLVTGTASFLAFFIYTFRFLHKHWHVLTTPDDPETSFGRRLVHLLKHFDNKDLSYHTYKKAQPPGQGRAIGSRGSEEPSPLHTNGSESPLSMSNGSDFVGGEVGILFPEIATPYQNTSADVPNNRNAIPGTVEMFENRI